MKSYKPRKPHESDKRIELENLIYIFANADEVTEEFVKFVNYEINKKYLDKLAFSLVNVSNKFFIYINENSELVLSPVTENSLKSVLDSIKAFNQNNENIDTSKIRDILLILGGGVLKSYDVYSKLSTINSSKEEIKALIYSKDFWIESRKKFHEVFAKEYLEKVTSLSEKIQVSEKVENAIYCVRGSIASGKSTFIENFIKESIDKDGDFSGIISTDRIKNNLIEKTDNLSGVDLVGYSFHEEASMLSDIILDTVISYKAPFILDKRMQEKSDLPSLLSKLKNTGLPVVIYDFKVDPVTSANRALKRSGIYPDSPVPTFDSFIKTYRRIEENRGLFIIQSMSSSLVKKHIIVVNKEKTEFLILKENYTVKAEDHNISVDFKRLEKTILLGEKTLQVALDEYSQSVLESRHSNEYYKAKILQNINLTSRSSKGNIDISASEDKKSKMKSDLTIQEISSQVKININSSIEYIFINKNLILASASVLRDFIGEIANKVNNKLILDKKDLFRIGNNSKKYNYVETKDVLKFYEKFIEEFYFKLNDVKSDKIELAGWVEWNIDFCGHFFTDGCGRIAKLISSWVLIRNCINLPNYLLGQDGFDTVRESYRKRYAIREKVKYTRPNKDVNYLVFLKYYKRLFSSRENKEQVLAAGGLIYNSLGEFLVLQTSKGKDKGKWVIPGGKLEINEIPLDAFKREVREETGLEVKNILPIGNRDYTALSGNQYHFYEYKAIACNQSGVKINDESLSYRWITEDGLKELNFTDSARNFMNRYFKESSKRYYENVEEIDINDLDIPHFTEHTMYKKLLKYVESKLPVKELDLYVNDISGFEVRGVFPDLKLISGLDFGFNITRIISESTQKENNSNSIRPIFILAERGGKKIIVCCTTPGRDHIVHYASMIGYYLREKNVSLSVYAYPDAENKIDKWTGLDETIISKGDKVILGYSTYFKNLFKNKGYSEISSTRNSFYISTRFKTLKGSIVNCLEADYGHWGNICDYLSTKICQLGAVEIIHIGKVGTLSSPEEVYKRIYIPKSFVIARRDKIFIGGATVKNSMEYFEAHTSAVHASITTTMEETFSQRVKLEDQNVETVDIESSKIALAIALHNLSSDQKVKYGAIHFASDYLKKEMEIDKDLDYDLSSERGIIKNKKYEILDRIFEIIESHL